MANHQNFFATTLTSNVTAGDTTTPLNSIPTVDAPFYLTFDATSVNGNPEVVYVTSKTATNVNHAALQYNHTTAEVVKMSVVAEELDGMYDSGMPYGMARQAIMNGNFDIWQRGTSRAIADVTNVFLADRWVEKASKDGGTLPTITASRQLLTSGDIANAFYFKRTAVNGAGTSLGVNSYHFVEQKIENGTRNLCGLDKKVTASFYAKSDIVGKRLGVMMLQTYGSGGSPTATEKIITQAPITLTSSWVKYTVTFTTNTLVGKTFGTAGDDYIGFRFFNMWGTTLGNTDVYPSVTAETYVGAGNIDIAQVQLCSGDVALPFQPKSYEEELRACQRYFQFLGNFSGRLTTTTNASIAGNFLTEMRATPTITLSGTPTIREVGVAFRNISAIASSSITKVGGYLDITCAAGTAANDAQLTASTFTTTNNISASAEL